MGMKTVALTKEEYIQVIKTIQRGGFPYMDNQGKVRWAKPNERVSFILELEANLGIRVGDVLNLKLSNFVKDGARWRIDIIESKTGKKRDFTVPDILIEHIEKYCKNHSIGKDENIFDITERAVQKHLKNTVSYLGLERISTHSFRKFYATDIYIKSNYNIELVRTLLQHSSSHMTQKYIGITSKEIETAITNHTIIV